MIKALNLNRQVTAILENAKDIGYEKQANSIWQAQFSLPADDPKNEKVQLLNYVEIEDDTNGEYIGLFRIIPKLTNKENNLVTYKCEHVLATLLDSSLFQYHQLTGYNTAQAIEYLLTQQKEVHWQEGTCSFTRFFGYSWENENLLSALFSIPKPFDVPYRWTWDTTTYPWKLNLVDPEVVATCRIREGYNLKGLEIEENPMSIYNRIYPLGAGEGVNQLTIAKVNGGVPYIENSASIAKYGIRETIWADKRFEDSATLKANAQALIQKWKEPIITWKASAADVSSITGADIDKLKEGRIVRIDVDGYPTTDLRIMKESKSDITGNPGDVQLELGNLVQDLATTLADLQQRQQINELYSAGATNILNFGYQDNCDNVVPALIPFYIDDDVVNVNTCELTFRTKKFRAYSKDTEGGGATVATSSSGGGSSTTTSAGGGTTVTSEQSSGQFDLATGDEVATLNGHHAHPLPSGLVFHTHDVVIGPHQHGVIIDNHSHSTTIPAHTHPVKHEIVEYGTLPTSVVIKVDGVTIPFTAIEGDRINLVDYMAKDTDGRITRGRHEVTITPNGLARIEADLILRCFIRSHLGGTY